MADAIKAHLLQLIEGLKVHKDIALANSPASQEATEAIGSASAADNRQLVIYAAQNVHNYITKCTQQ